MRITKLKITNFREYKCTIEIAFDNLTVFAGKNDIDNKTSVSAYCDIREKALEIKSEIRRNKNDKKMTSTNSKYH